MRENGAKDRAKMPFAPNNQKSFYKAKQTKVLAERNQTHAPIGVLSSTPSPKPDNLNPALAYVNLTIGTIENNGPQKENIGMKVKCLIDSGCSKTTMSYKLYSLLMSHFNQNKANLFKENKKRMLLET